MEASKSEAIQSFIRGKQEFCCKVNVSPTLIFNLKNAKKRIRKGFRFILFCQGRGQEVRILGQISSKRKSFGGKGKGVT
jgi:hypothetical protein